MIISGTGPGLLLFTSNRCRNRCRNRTRMDIKRSGSDSFAEVREADRVNKSLLFRV